MTRSPSSSQPKPKPNRPRLPNRAVPSQKSPSNQSLPKTANPDGVVTEKMGSESRVSSKTSTKANWTTSYYVTQDIYGRIRSLQDLYDKYHTNLPTNKEIKYLYRYWKQMVNLSKGFPQFFECLGAFHPNRKRFLRKQLIGLHDIENKINNNFENLSKSKSNRERFGAVRLIIDQMKRYWEIHLEVARMMNGAHYKNCFDQLKK